MNTINIGISPIGWSNDDLPELGGHISFEQCLQEMAEAQYQGCEIGHKFPRVPNELRAALAPHHLKIASAWFSTYFTLPNKSQEAIEGFIKHATFLKEMGAKVIVVCECGHAIQGLPLPILHQQPKFTDHEWDLLISGLHTIGTIANNMDMSIVYHHHMGTGIQTKKDIDRLMTNTDPQLVSLLFDTGHLYFAGENPLDILKQHAPRIKHVHLKDIREPIKKSVFSDHLSFLDAVKAGVFTVPGDGIIDFEPIIEYLIGIQYHGWFIVEAEQDPHLAPPLEYAKKGRAYLRNMLGF